MLMFIAFLLVLLVFLHGAQIALEWKRRERLIVREQVEEIKIKKEQRAEARKQSKERIKEQAFWREVENYNGDI